jgi:hypothetical protein
MPVECLRSIIRTDGTAQQAAAVGDAILCQCSQSNSIWSLESSLALALRAVHCGMRCVRTSMASVKHARPLFLQLHSARCHAQELVSDRHEYHVIQLWLAPLYLDNRLYLARDLSIV